MTCWVEELADRLLQSDGDELLVNGSRAAYIVRGESTLETPLPFKRHGELQENLQQFAFSQGKRLDPGLPFAGGILPKRGFRWHAILSSVTPDGCLFSIRRQRFEALSLADFNISPTDFHNIAEAIHSRSNILCIGETGSGKTTMLSCIMKHFLALERLVIIESIDEMQLLSSRWIRLCEGPSRIGGDGQISINQLIEQSLRLRPDRLVLAEIRGKEIVGFQQAIFTGHRGCLATVHAESKEEAINRLSQLSEIHMGIAFDWARFIHPCYFLIMGRGSPPYLRSIS
jgi:pilus assembly protein CpaF